MLKRTNAAGIAALVLFISLNLACELFDIRKYIVMALSLKDNVAFCRKCHD
jgi:hypothetical protein